MKTVVVEGWRTSCHSYALVNQHQLLQLLNEPRLTLYHRDIPFFRHAWSHVDSGLSEESKSSVAAIPEPPPTLRPDVTYRISYPFRIHGGTGRVFVFATNELDRTLSEDCVGLDGRPSAPDFESTEIVTPSSWSRRAFIQAGCPPERIHVVPHGVDPLLATPIDAAERRSFREQLRLSDQAFAFLNVGAMSRNKGVGPLIAAFAVHRRAFPHSVLILKGGEALYGNVLQMCCEEACRLRPEARDHGLAESLRHVRSNLSSHGVGRLYRAADAYVSAYRAEGFNLPVLEAMASDLPVIVTRGGSTDDFCPDATCLKITADIVSGRLGTQLEPRIDSIVEQMARMVEDAHDRERRAQAAKEHVLPRYSWHRVAGQLTELLLTA